MNIKLLRSVSIFICTLFFISCILYHCDYIYAYNLPSNKNYGFSAEEARAIVNNHETIYNSNGVPYFIYMNDVKKWKSCYDLSVLDSELTDDEVVDILSSSNYLQSAFTQAQYANLSSHFFKALGILTNNTSTLFVDLISSHGGELTSGITYDEDNGITILSDSVDKLREELIKQYCDSIGLNISKPVNIPQFLIGKLSSTYDHEEDYISDYNNIKGEKFVFGCVGSRSIALRLNFDSEPSYLYVTSDNKIVGTDCELGNIFNFSTTIYSYSIPSDEYFNGTVFYYDDFKYKTAGLADKISHDSLMDWVVPLYYYSDSDKPLWVFRSYEALYNYVHGSQTAYLSSKVNEMGENITISIDDMNTNITDKMDELINSINNKKEGMSADELQDVIDKGLENISGNIEDIKDNAEEMNNKLDSLLSIMDKQNDILLQILGVTEYIAYNTTDENGKTYEISDIQPHLMKCFTGIKNMLLYGECSFDEHVPQVSSYSLNNDVSALSVDSSYIMNDTGLICNVGGRDFYKVNTGSAFVGVYRNSGGYCGPLLVSEDSNAVTYNAIWGGSNIFSYAYTISYANKTWYVSNDEYFMPSMSSNNSVHIISNDRLSPSDAALLLLQQAGVSEDIVVDDNNNGNEDNDINYPEDVVGDYHNGILGKFPFSVPYQLYEWLQVLQCEPKFMIGKKDDEDCIVNFDLSQYDSWAEHARSFLKLSFVLAVAVGTYHKFKGEI